MIEHDTIKLLRECDAGIKMGVSSIDEVLDYTHSGELKKYLTDCKNKHEKLKEEIQGLLDKYHDDGKEPNAMAKGMSWMKTNVKLAVMPGDHSVADLVTDGLNMGVKSLTKCRNRYTGASESAKQIAHDLISSELSLTQSLRQFL